MIVSAQNKQEENQQQRQWKFYKPQKWEKIIYYGGGKIWLLEN